MPIPWNEPLPAEIAPLLAGFPVVIMQPVAWGEMDFNQHLNNVVYFRYMENSRVEYFRRLDWDSIRQAESIWGILRDAQLRFRTPVLFPDTLYVGALISGIGTDRFVLEHRMVSEQQRAVTTEGHGTIVSFDYKSQSK